MRACVLAPGWTVQAITKPVSWAHWTRSWHAVRVQRNSSWINTTAPGKAALIRSSRTTRIKEDRTHLEIPNTHYLRARRRPQHSEPRYLISKFVKSLISYLYLRRIRCLAVVRISAVRIVRSKSGWRYLMEQVLTRPLVSNSRSMDGRSQCDS